MKIKIIVLLLVLATVLFSGCTGNEQPTPEENVTPEETVTPEEVETPEEMETPAEAEIPTPEEVETPAVTEPGEEVTPGDNETENETETGTGDGPVIVTPAIRATPYTIRLDNFRAYPSSLDIKEEETVAWINYQDSPRRVFTLQSEEGLFEDINLVYRRSFAYTFNETGTYNFTIVGQPRMNVTITVSEP